jgi:hypothetical protein
VHCATATFSYIEDLKSTIINHPLWTLVNPANPPIFSLFVSNFIAAGKKTKMIYVSVEQSKAMETSDLFKKIYDGEPNAYPNGYMMLLIPLIDGQQPTTKFRAKILFNYDQYGDKEEVFSFGGLEDLKNQIKLRNGKIVTLCTLLKSIPASKSMFHPQLFQYVEPNVSGIITMRTFQKADHDLVYQLQNTLEFEIHHMITEGEEERVFVNNEEGVWFSGVNKMKTGRLLAAQQSELEANISFPYNIPNKTYLHDVRNPNSWSVTQLF